MHPIFPGDSEMAALCRAHDWASTPLGAPEGWPVALRTLVRTLLTSRHPMVLFWGPELVQFYNDAYRPSLGGEGGRHPSALGARARECWEELWHVVGPQVDQVMSGGPATWHEDQRIPTFRNGRLEEVYWSYGYSPAWGDDGRIEGVLVVCQETTAQHQAREEASLAQSRLATMLENMSDGFLTMDRAWRFTFLNSMAERLLQCSRDEVLGQVAWEAFPEARGSIFQTEYERAAREERAVSFEAWFPPLEKWFSIHAYPSEGGVAVYFQDVTERRETEARLREREHLLGIAGRMARIGGWRVDLEEGLCHWSNEVCDIHEVPHGTTPTVEEGIGFYAPSWRETIGHAFGRCALDGTPFDLDLQIVTARGRVLWVRAIGEALRDSDGRIRTVQGAFQEIQRQKEAEEALQASESRLGEMAARLSTTLESVTDAFYLLDPEWRFTFVNAQAERVLERSRDEILGSVIWEAFPATAGSELEGAYREAMASGSSARLVYHYPPLARWFDVRAYPSSEGLGVYFRDVTEERAADARLREQAELLERAQDAILVRDLDHTIVFWNTAAARIYGWPKEEAEGRSIRDLLYRDPTRFDEATAQVLDTGEWSGELEHLRRDGTTVSVEGRWSLVRDEKGLPRRILAINTDVTERKRLLSQFLRAQRMESIGTLAGGIAHDLNNVLSPILLSIGLLRDEITDPELRDVLATIEGSAQRGADMVQQVLGFARGFDRSDIRVDLPRIVQDMERVVRDTFPRNIAFHAEVSGLAGILVGDPTQVHQVLLNLVVNARDAMPEGGTLRVSVDRVELDEHYAAMSPQARAGAYARITVEDSGQGMPAEVAAQAFDPFYTTKEVGKGTGLGLSTVAAIVRGHGGFVNLYSEVGSGTTLRAYFPLRAGDAEGTDDFGGERSVLELPRGNGELVLVVDDEGSVRDITRQTLETFGYRVVTATDGADAVATYGRQGDQIALVLTDMVMPIMDGPTTIRALKRMNEGVRIIGASGLGTNGGVARAADSGVRYFLPKPYTAESLLTMVAEVLAEEGEEGSAGAR